mmetsp:Transcript_85062/g.244135  ORF Transcript_85062/g.244135 Transcript_85062/m.244135 type:complete len:82 (-) Transcript_85062:726-971(-)
MSWSCEGKVSDACMGCILDVGGPMCVGVGNALMAPPAKPTMTLSWLAATTAVGLSSGFDAALSLQDHIGQMSFGSSSDLAS